MSKQFDFEEFKRMSLEERIENVIEGGPYLDGLIDAMVEEFDGNSDDDENEPDLNEKKKQAEGKEKAENDGKNPLKEEPALPKTSLEADKRRKEVLKNTEHGDKVNEDQLNETICILA